MYAQFLCSKSQAWNRPGKPTTLSRCSRHTLKFSKMLQKYFFISKFNDFVNLPESENNFVMPKMCIIIHRQNCFSFNYVIWQKSVIQAVFQSTDNLNEIKKCSSFYAAFSNKTKCTWTSTPISGHLRSGEGGRGEFQTTTTLWR